MGGVLVVCDVLQRPVGLGDVFPADVAADAAASRYLSLSLSLPGQGKAKKKETLSSVSSQPVTSM